MRGLRRIALPLLHRLRLLGLRLGLPGRTGSVRLLGSGFGLRLGRVLAWWGVLACRGSCGRLTVLRRGSRGSLGRFAAGIVGRVLLFSRFLRLLRFGGLFSRFLLLAAEARDDEPAGPLQDLTKSLPQLGPFAELLGKNVAGSKQGVGRRGNVALRADELGRTGVQVGTRRVRFEDFAGQRLQTTRAAQRSQRLLLGLERKIKILQPLGRADRVDLFGQRFGQLPLGLDRPEDRLLAVGQQTRFCQPGLDLPDLVLIQPPGLVLTIPGDKGDRVSLVQELDDHLNLTHRDAQATGHVPQIDSYRTGHKGLAGVGLGTDAIVALDGRLPVFGM